MQTPRVLLITDAAYPEEVVLRVIEAAARVLPAGAFAVQLREKGRVDRAAWATRLRGVTRELGVALVVNGNVRLAREVGAEGVHFGGGATAAEVEVGRGLWRSMAAHRDEDVTEARGRGVDAVLVSPIFASPGKGAPRGVEAVKRAVELAEGALAVLALGGIGVAEATACREVGADGVAVIRALLGAREPGRVASQLLGTRSPALEARRE
jgi:thiamine-phosphate pyrophosphorylase